MFLSPFILHFTQTSRAMSLSLVAERGINWLTSHKYCARWFVFDGVVVVGGHYCCCCCCSCSPIPKTMFKCNCEGAFLFYYFDTLCEGISHRALYISRSINASNINMKLIFDCRPKVVYWRWLLLLLYIFFSIFQREAKGRVFIWCICGTRWLDR